ncbi:MAG TPA: hypothetical protein VNM16_12825 [Bacillota bacterium]|nr:hypothetical protein [Bacillota bacterium]
MLHWIAFIVIGLVVGFIFGSQPRANRTMAVILGLVGGLVGGAILRSSAGATGRYGSIVLSIVLAAVLALLGRGIGARSR